MRDAPVQWRDPDLHEVIEFLQNPNAVIKANAAAYLQHLCYMDDPVKAKTRQLGGIPPLVALLSHEIPEIHRNSCGALRYFLSFISDSVALVFSPSSKSEFYSEMLSFKDFLLDSDFLGRHTMHTACIWLDEPCFTVQEM